MEDDTKKGTDPEIGAEDEEQEEDEDSEYQKELDRIESKKGSKYSPIEKAGYNLKKMAEEIKRLGGDPSEFLAANEDGDRKDKGEFKIESPEQLQELVDKIVEEKVGTVRSTFAKAEVDTRISKLTKTPKEKQLVEYHFNNTIKPTGDIDEDVENAYIIANKHRIKQTFEALGGKQKANEEKGDGIGSGQKRPKSGKEPQVSAQEKAFAQSNGLVWSEDENKYVSPARLKHLESRKKK